MAEAESTVQHSTTPVPSFGISGWSYPDWQGWVYPPGCRDTLAHVAPYVDFIEINSSFYAPPQAKVAAGWVARTTHLPQFFFTAKVNRQFTHEGRLDAADLERFREGLRPLREAGRLRVLLAQFPAAFDNTSEHASRVAQLREAFADTPLVVEVRHRSWQAPDALAFLQRLGVSVANLDYPAVGEAFDLDLCLVGTTRYLRMHGRNRTAWANPRAGRDETYNYLYSEAELDAIAARLKKLSAGAKQVMVAANNHYQGKELVNALELKARTLSRPVPVPPLLRERYPRLDDVAGGGDGTAEGRR
jgi:uncharacterized protein YecE (DUF72 family)